MPSCISPPQQAQILLEARQLRRSSPAGHSVLLAPANLSLSAGERLAICGASGSGKSVLLRALALLDAPDGGDVIWMNRKVTAQAIPEYRTRVCYLPQRPALVEGTVLDNLRLPFTLKALRQRRFDLEAAGALLRAAARPEAFLNRQADALSGGEAQIVALVRVLLLAPQVILFDEPTAALDPGSTAAVEGLVHHWFQAEGHARAYLWISHDQQQIARMSDRQLQMHDGVLLPGSPA